MGLSRMRCSASQEHLLLVGYCKLRATPYCLGPTLLCSRSGVRQHFRCLHTSLGDAIHGGCAAPSQALSALEPLVLGSLSFCIRGGISWHMGLSGGSSLA